MIKVPVKIGKLSRHVTVLGFIAIYAVLLYYFKPDLIFSATTTAGGDTGAHHYVARYLIDHLLPEGKVAGWSPGWYAGFPMLQFYFPLPFLIIAFLGSAIKYQVAFKIGTILGIFLLPVATHWAVRTLGFRFPLPVMAAGFTLPFLFMESYSIYGANILSTLAGEFGYSLSFSLSILFLVLLNRDVVASKFRVSTGVLLAAVALSHIVTTIMIVTFSSYYLLSRLKLKQVIIIIGVFTLGFALSAFWSLPFAVKIGYTAHMQWDQLKGLNELFPDPVRPFLILSVIGLVGAIYRRDNRMYLFLWATAVSGALFFLLPPGRLWNGRLVPYFYYFTFIWAAYGLWLSRRVIAQLLYSQVFLPKSYADYAVVILAIGIASMAVFGTSKVAESWISWNYSGFEGKKHWKSFNEINQYIKALPPGRVMIEHTPDIDMFGTPRAFELLPYFADHPTMEGTLMEASLTAPFHFVNQAELSLKPSNAILGVEYPGLNVDRGVEHLRLYNIKYFLAVTDEVKYWADENGSLNLLKKFNVAGTDTKFSLYEVSTDGYVTIPRYEPLLVSTDDWRKTALSWYLRPEFLDVPLIDAGKAKELEGRYRSISSDLAGDIDSLVKRLPAADARISNIILKNDGLKFTTTAVGAPHWIKISYFPNWKVRGADGPYLASPSLMLVIPRRENVELYYGDTWSDIAGRMISVAGWGFVGAYAALNIRRRLSLHLLAGPKSRKAKGLRSLRGGQERGNV